MKLELISRLHSDGPSRPSIVLVHGACMAAWVWKDNFIPYFFEKGFNVYAISLRNHGSSAGSANLRFTSVKDYVEDVNTIVNAIEGQVLLIGHSMGGFTLQHYMNQLSAEKIRAIVLLCAVPPAGLWQLIPKLIRDYPFHFLISCLRMSWLPIIRDDARLKELMFSKNFPIEKMKTIMPLIQEESFLAFLEMVFMRLPKVRRSPVPVMVVGAGNDYLISRSSTKKMADHYNAAFKMVDSASHCFMSEPGWEEVAEDISSFFKAKIAK